MDITIIKELGPWGLAVLAGVVFSTQVLKPHIKELGVSGLWIFGVQSILAAIGASCLAIGTRITGVKWDMVPLIWFVVSFTGPLLYMYIIKPFLQRQKKETLG